MSLCCAQICSKIVRIQDQNKSSLITHNPAIAHMSHVDTGLVSNYFNLGCQAEMHARKYYCLYMCIITW